MQCLQQLLAILERPHATAAQIQVAVGDFYIGLSRANDAQIQATVGGLATALDFDNLTHAGHAAMVLGALIHKGYDPTPAIEPLIGRLNYLLTMCGRLVNAVERELDKTSGSMDREEEDLFDRTLYLLAPTRPIEMEAWKALSEFFYLPGVELFCRSHTAQTTGQYLRELTKPIAHYHRGAHWLDRILAVLFDEPLLVIEPKTQLGFVGKMSGIADNFQLHTLLMDVFPSQQPCPQPRVSQAVVEIAKGSGSQCDRQQAIVGAWSLYNYDALGADLILPNATDYGSSHYWIWGEGSPAEITLFSGFRVVLLGDPSGDRRFDVQRAFANLPAQITCDRLLSRGEVDAWLAVMARS